MAITRWNPSTDIRSLWNEFDRMFDRLTRTRDFDSDESEFSNVGNWRPAVDITEREKDYMLTAELPGLEEDDIHLSVKNNVLTLKGEKKHSREKEGENSYYRERLYGTFQRMIRFDTELDPNKVNAEYENGVLKVTLPKSKESMHKEIPVSFKK